MKSEKIQDIYELTPLQQGMLFHSLYTPGVDVYNIQLEYTLHGHIDVDEFHRAWQHIVARHPILRTGFSWENLERPYQVVHESAEIEIFRHDWRSLPAHQQDADFAALANSDKSRSFSLQSPPLMRLTLVRLSGLDYRFLWTFHHMILEGWSATIVMREVDEIYQAYTEGVEAQLAPTLPYSEYIRWLQQMDTTPAETYWRKTLKGFSEPNRLPMDMAQGDAPPKVAHCAELRLRLSPEDTQTLKRFAKQNHLTLATVFLGAWALLLGRYTDSDDIVFGVVVSGRSAELDGIDSMVGLSVNTLPGRVCVDANTHLLPWLQALQRDQAELRKYEHSSIVQAQAFSDVPHGQPLFESLVAFQNWEGRLPDAWLGIEVSDNHVREGIDYPMALVVSPGRQMTVDLRYDPQRFEESDVLRLQRHYKCLLKSFAAMPDPLLPELPMLSESERRLVVEEWNDTDQDYGDEARIHRLVGRQAIETPDRVALQFEQQALTYAELNGRANQLARVLRAKGVGPEVLVGVLAERSVEMVVALLAVLKSGGAYVPLDPEYPSERLTHMLEDTQARLALVQPGLADRLPAGTCELLELDATWGGFTGESDAELPEVGTPDNLAYVIFTSGSTGRPKGAMNNHRGFANRLLWMQDEYGLNSDDVVLQKTPFSFDVSGWEFFWPLMTGARLVIARPGGHRDSAYLVDLIKSSGITTLHFVPSMLQVFLDEQDIASCSSLKRVICSGEALPHTLQERFFTRLPGVELHNLYGPTEAAIDVTYWACRPGDQRLTVPIGRPISNTRVYVLDSRMQPVPVGVAGELHIGGVQVGRGYVGRDDLTAKHFIPDPFSRIPGARLYRTGDKVRHLSDGAIEFLGRLDDQVKLRGHRIELGEVDSALSQHRALREAVTAVHDLGDGDRRLVAYLVPNEDYARPIRQLLRLRSDGRLEGRETFDLPNGMSVVHLNRNETEFLYDEVFEQAPYLRHGIDLHPGDCVFDVGANIGFFSLAITRYQPDLKIFAFEPIPEVCEIMRLNAEIYGLDLEPFECGLSRESGTAEFDYYPNLSIFSSRYPDTAAQGEVVKAFLRSQGEDNAMEQVDAGMFEELLLDRMKARKVSCRLSTVSGVMRERGVDRIDLLKIDVEKSELDVMAGINEDDWPKIRQVVVEVHDIDGELDAALGALTQQGFVVVQDQERGLEETNLHMVYARRVEEMKDRKSVKAGEAPGSIQCSSPTHLADELRIWAENRLPGYMVPSAFVALETLPVNANGKVDRRALPAPEGERQVKEAYVAPLNELEVRIAEIWREVLKVEQVGVHDNFFDIGGNSLLALKLQDKLTTQLGTKGSVTDLFRFPTVHLFAEQMGSKGKRSESVRKGRDRASQQRKSLGNRRNPRKRNRK